MNRDGRNAYRPSGPAHGLSFLSRTRPQREPIFDASHNPKGPLGLHTLSEPSRPNIADIVFVHGMGGGSQSTWTKDSNADLFWPKTWLPQDDAFQDVRIHTFGYDSDLSHESVLNIHDFAKSLLGALLDCPRMEKHSNTPLIMVGHSMGGLVIKRSYILAKQHQEYALLAGRMRAMYFLATPHRGSNLAVVLKRIMHALSGGKPFLADLQRNSLATQSINDEFPQHCQDLQLFSFYETVPLSYALGKTLIVDKDLATLGYPNERAEYVNADHRDICRFYAPTDPNYLIIRNALARTLENLRHFNEPSIIIPNEDADQSLNDFLDISDAPEDDLHKVDARFIEGSCEWLTEMKSFQRWLELTDPALYWITAKPATGKSVLSGYIVRHLKRLGEDCAFFFFNYNDRSTSTIGHFLRSVAWQMAWMQPVVLRAIMHARKKTDSLAKADFRTIWRKLFLDGILTTEPLSTQYWVIDGVDECKNPSDLVPLLLKAVELFNVKIIATSRDNFEAYGVASNPLLTIITQHIPQEETQKDIELYLTSNMNSLPRLELDSRQGMIDTLLQKSAGCFLWVNLVLQELRRAHTSTQILEKLEQIPAGMDSLYYRILGQMEQEFYEVHLAKAILTWVVCSARPLTTEELHFALELDIEDGINSIESTVLACCGQLVYIDSSSRVHMVHQTAKDFLLQRDHTSTFAVDKRRGHLRLTLTCLEYLRSEEMRAPRKRKLSLNKIIRSRSAFAAYACSALSDHIPHISPEQDDEFIPMMAKFLRSANVLSWIEYLAQKSELRCMVHAGRSLRKYLQMRSKHIHPFGNDVAIVDDWATDLVRLVMEFGSNLSSSPASIFDLIPPFCPAESAPKKQFGKSSRGIKVVGLDSGFWDDCLSTIVHPHEQVTALACSPDYFAMATATGRVAVYHDLTCQQAQSLRHDGPVRLLEFSQTGNTLASCGLRKICIWSVSSWQQVWTFKIEQECMAVRFVEEDRYLIAGMKSNLYVVWDLACGELYESANWTGSLQTGSARGFRHQPQTAAICTGSKLLAIAYKTHDIILWDIEDYGLYETLNKEHSARGYSTGTNVSVTGGMVFSREPNEGLLAASYSDGELVVFDVDHIVVQARTRAFAQTMASSNDGQILATADSSGMVQLLDFLTLKLIYRIKSEDYGVRALAFSWHSRRLLDIGGSTCRVWQPPALLNEDLDEERSDTVSVSTGPQEGISANVELATPITALVPHHDGEFFFCGKEDGAIYVYESKTGHQTQLLLAHAKNLSITALNYNQDLGTLISVDSSSRIMCHALSYRHGMWYATIASFDFHTGTAIIHILLNTSHTRLLVHAVEETSLYSIEASGTRLIATIKSDKDCEGRWTTHPLYRDYIIHISGDVARIHEWQSLKAVTGSDGIILHCGASRGLNIRDLVSCSEGSLIATTFREKDRSHSKSRLMLWTTSAFSPEARTASPVQRKEVWSNDVQHVVGTHLNRLIFLHSSGWICSIELGARQTEQADRHFFVPLDWLSASDRFMVSVTCRGDIVFVRKHEVAVVQRGLETSEQLELDKFDLNARRASRPTFGKPRSRGSGHSPFRARGSDPAILSPRSPTLSDEYTLELRPSPDLLSPPRTLSPNGFNRSSPDKSLDV